MLTNGASQGQQFMPQHSGNHLPIFSPGTMQQSCHQQMPETTSWPNFPTMAPNPMMPQGTPWMMPQGIMMPMPNCFTGQQSCHMMGLGSSAPFHDQTLHSNSRRSQRAAAQEEECTVVVGSKVNPSMNDARLGLPMFKDGTHKISTAYQWFGGVHKHGMRKALTKKIRLSCIIWINPDTWTPIRLAVLSEEQVDMLCFLLCTVKPDTKVADLQCSNKHELRECLLREHLRLITAQPERLSSLASDLSNIEIIAHSHGYPISLMTPDTVAYICRVTGGSSGEAGTAQPDIQQQVPRVKAASTLTSAPMKRGSAQLALPCAEATSDTSSSIMSIKPKKLKVATAKAMQLQFPVITDDFISQSAPEKTPQAPPSKFKSKFVEVEPDDGDNDDAASWGYSPPTLPDPDQDGDELLSPEEVAAAQEIAEWQDQWCEDMAGMRA